jgi:GT2 family glycosyltransferase
MSIGPDSTLVRRVGTSVVIVTRKPEGWLERCLTAVAPQAAETIVVDNGSFGDTCERLCERFGARRLRQEDNLGFARGSNVGVAAAREDHIALLNDDAFPEPGWLEHSEAVLRDETIGAVVPKLLFAWRRGIVRIDDPVRFNGRHPLPYGRYVTSVTVGGVDVTSAITVLGAHEQSPDGFWSTGATMVVLPLVHNNEDVRVNGEPVELLESFDMVNNAGSFLHLGGWCGDIGFGHRDDGSFDTATDRFAACGAAVVARRDVWERVGGLAQDFFAYYEDSDWSWRLRLGGYRVRYEPSVVVRHVHAQTGGEGSPWFKFFVARNRVLCLTRNAPRRVVARTLTQLPPLPPGVAKSLAQQVPLALRDRRVLARGWEETPEAVWSAWAGRNVPQ